MSACPCGSGITFAECCEPIITGARQAATPEQLMRARYTAYTMAQMDFIYESIHPDHRQGYDHKGTKEWAEKSEWLGLTIVGTTKGASGDDDGEVEFVARFRNNGMLVEHHERSQFVRKDGRWLFTEGIMQKPTPVVAPEKPGRNEPCSCGSGKKYKKCCGA